MPLWLQVLLAVGSPLFAAGGAYAAVKVKLEWHWAEISRAHTRIEQLEEFVFERVSR